jgi:D-cysteine desulfhydrase
LEGRADPAAGGTDGVKRRTFLAAGAGAIATIAAGGGGGAAFVARRINRIERFPPAELAVLRAGASTPLFERFPGLADAVPWLPLGRFPTPIEPLALDGSRAAALFVKRDDLASPLYGGNKTRKLEHVLAEAQLAGATALVTIGAIGSNHGLATALHGRALGFDVRLALFDQPVTSFVHTNVSALVVAQAGLQYGGSIAGALLAARRMHRAVRAAGGRPYFIMPGGSSRIGNIGHVAAALELAGQVRAGELPEPDRIFVALGTCGTAAGLVTGLKLAGLRTRVSAVRVVNPVPASRITVRYFAQDLADHLHDYDPAVPRLRILASDFDVITNYFGNGYGEVTRAASDAVDWASPALRLETTYTGKALAACLDYCRTEGEGQTVLFWNTFNSSPVPQAPSLDGLPVEILRALAG